MPLRIIDNTYSAELRANWDIVIIGAGMAGLWAATRLDPSRQRILLVDSGPYISDLHRSSTASSSDLFNYWQNPSCDPYWMRSVVSSRPPHYSQTGIRRVVGGRSIYWQGVCLPIGGMTLQRHWPAVLRMRLRQGAEKCGSYNESINHLSSVNKLHSGSRSEKELCSTISNPSLSFVPTCRAGELEVQLGLKRFIVHTPLTEIARNDRSGEIWLLPSSSATRLITRRGKIESIEISSSIFGRMHLRGKAIVLSASTIGITKLLVPAIRASTRSSATGRLRIADHIVRGLYLRIPEPGFELARLASDSPLVCSVDDDDQCNIFISLERRDSGVSVDAWAMIAQSYDMTCRITTLRPKIKVTAGLSRTDYANVRRGEEMIDATVSTLLSSFGIRPTFKSRQLSGFPSFGQVIAHADRTVSRSCHGIKYTLPLGGIDHECETLPIGEFFSTNLESKHFQNLYSVGPALFPAIGAANPSLTTMAMARGLGERLRNVS